MANLWYQDFSLEKSILPGAVPVFLLETSEHYERKVQMTPLNNTLASYLALTDNRCQWWPLMSLFLRVKLGHFLIMPRVLYV